MSKEQDFATADKAIERAVSTIEQAMVELLEATLSQQSVATDYVIEQLIGLLIDRNPVVLDWLNKQRGESTIKLANALVEWRDTWESR
jgi:hypothetical protein